jgi:putative ABC transport system permease protein
VGIAMRTFIDIFGQTMRTLWANKLRSFLTMFGIAWGVGSLLLLVGLGEGFRSGNRRQLANLGNNIVFVEPGLVPPREGSTIGSRPYFITEQDYLDIKREASHVAKITPVLQRGDIRAISEFQSANGQVFGVLPVYNQIRYLPMADGRWFNDQDILESRAVAVIGYQMRKNMFPGAPALGAMITLNGSRFQVIGVLDTTGKDEGNMANTRLYIPFTTMQQMFPLKDENLPLDAISFINYSPTSREAHELAEQEVKKIIARNHQFDTQNEDAFRIFDTVKTEEMVGKIFDAMNWFLGSVGLVTLGLGAIGIINIMLVAVTERTKEIGLRKALGATNRNILTQFFLEGAFLTVVSGFVGLALASGFMFALNLLPAPPGFDTPQIVPWSVAMAIGTLGLCGVIAGVYPARKAAMMEPVEALRKD